MLGIIRKLLYIYTRVEGINVSIGPIENHTVKPRLMDESIIHSIVDFIGLLFAERNGK